MPDVFVSYAHRDAAWVHPLVAALEDRGLGVWVDRRGIDDFAAINEQIGLGLGDSMVVLACYSRTYPTRPACQWELTRALTLALWGSAGTDRVLVVVPPEDSDGQHIQPLELRTARFVVAETADATKGVASAVADRVSRLRGSGAVVLGRLPREPPAWHPVRSAGSDGFVGRFSELWAIRSALHAEESSLDPRNAGQRPVQVRGLGGEGKTLLVQEYALRFGGAYPGGVFSLRMLDEDAEEGHAPISLDDRLKSELAQLGSSLGLAAGAMTTVSDARAALARAMDDRACLWLVDDVAEGLTRQQLELWFAPVPQARTLLTTRSHGYGYLATVDLGRLSPEDGLNLLAARLPPGDAAEQQAAAALVEDLGGHALALAVAAAGVAAMGYETFRAHLAASADLLEQVAEMLVEELPTGHARSITATLVGSLNRLSPAGADLLALVAELAAAPVSGAVLDGVFAVIEEIPEPSAQLRRASAVHQATSQALVRLAAGPGQAMAWQVHPLVTRVVRLRDADPHRRERLARAAVTVFTQLLRRDWPAVDRELLLAHARHLVVTRAEVSALVEAGELAQLADQVARVTRLPDDVRAARTVFERLLTAAGGAGPAIADETQEGLAFWTGELGYLTGDVSLMAEARATYLALLAHTTDDGRRRLALSRDMARLDAEIGHRRGDPVARRGAVTRFEELMRGFEEVHGVDDRATLDVGGHAAHWLGETGDAAGALARYLELLARHRDLFGASDPGTCKLGEHVAHWTAECGDLAGAVQLYSELLEDMAAAEGPEVLRLRLLRADLVGRSGDLGEADRLVAELHDRAMTVFGHESGEGRWAAELAARWCGGSSQPSSERAALSNFLLAEAGKPRSGESVDEALQRASRVAGDMQDWSTEALRAAVGYEPRRAMYAELRWTREEVPLAALRPWPEMGGLPASWTAGTVVDTARAVRDDGVPAGATRLAAMLATLEASPGAASELLHQALPIVVPESSFASRDPVPGAPWRVDDGCHRVVCAAVLDPDAHVLCLVGRSSRPTDDPSR